VFPPRAKVPEFDIAPVVVVPPTVQVPEATVTAVSVVLKKSISPVVVRLPVPKMVFETVIPLEPPARLAPPETERFAIEADGPVFAIVPVDTVIESPLPPEYPLKVSAFPPAITVPPVFVNTPVVVKAPLSVSVPLLFSVVTDVPFSVTKPVVVSALATAVVTVTPLPPLSDPEPVTASVPMVTAAPAVLVIVPPFRLIVSPEPL
jgi:hypothetical protein